MNLIYGNPVRSVLKATFPKENLYFLHQESQGAQCRTTLRWFLKVHDKVNQSFKPVNFFPI